MKDKCVYVGYPLTQEVLNELHRNLTVTGVQLVK